MLWQISPYLFFRWCIFTFYIFRCICFIDEKGEFTGWYWLGKPTQEETDNTNDLTSIKRTEFPKDNKENTTTKHKASPQIKCKALVARERENFSLGSRP